MAKLQREFMEAAWKPWKAAPMPMKTDVGSKPLLTMSAAVEATQGDGPEEGQRPLTSARLPGPGEKVPDRVSSREEAQGLSRQRGWSCNGM